ncbi:MAG: hypothetical protein JWO91_3413 [Acidobacteriaceae bacterium]|nr:hypothetical protein [Acidobacteriaceae bacterium]
MLRTSDAVRLGVHPRTLYALRDSGELLSVARGLYRLAKAPPLTHPDWVTVASPATHAVISRPAIKKSSPVFARPRK